MMFNPYSGRPRHPSDISSDPSGLLMLDPDEQMFAAPTETGIPVSEQPAEPTKCPWCGVTGPDFDESEKPSDYCHHDVAQITHHGTLCSVCRKPQFMTPGGLSCPDGHGGAESV